MEVRCWQCDKIGHLSLACPKGERYFICNRPGHKSANCPSKSRVSRAEKGKDIASMEEPERKKVQLRMGDRREAPYKEMGMDKSKSAHAYLDLSEDRGDRKDGDGERLRKSAMDAGAQLVGLWRKEGVEMGKRPGSSFVIKMKEKQDNVRVENESRSFDNRLRRMAPVFLIKSERAAEERAALRAAGGGLPRQTGTQASKILSTR